MREIGRCHPLVNALYFTVVIGFSMVLMHPIYLGISLVSGLLCAFLTGKRSERGRLCGLLLCVIGAAVLNPLINHEGVTVLGYLPSGNPLTLESICYGAAAGAMLAAVISRFFCLNRVMTGDQWMYLLGRIMPSLSLILSMTLRFVPKYRQELRAIRYAQRGIGRDAADGSTLQKLKHGIHTLSILITRCLEDSVDTADSMKSRGYGMPGRTAYSNFSFTTQDRTILLLLLGLSLFVLVNCVCGGAYFRYFPGIKGNAWSARSLFGMLAYLAVSVMPAVIEGREAIRWRKLRSKI